VVVVDVSLRHVLQAVLISTNAISTDAISTDAISNT
jgi:hypothetical protein